MAEIDDIKRRAKIRYSRLMQPADIRQAFEDRAFLLELLDTMASDHLAEIRQMEENFRTYIDTHAEHSMKGGDA
jgi:hypothetical protein